VSAILGCDTASLDEWCPKFRDKIFPSSSKFQFRNNDVFFGFSTREMRPIFRYCYKGCGKILQSSGKRLLMVLNPQARDYKASRCRIMTLKGRD